MHTSGMFVSSGGLFGGPSSGLDGGLLSLLPCSFPSFSETHLVSERSRFGNTSIGLSPSSGKDLSYMVYPFAYQSFLIAPSHSLDGLSLFTYRSTQVRSEVVLGSLGLRLIHLPF